MPTDAEKRIAAVQAQAPNVETGETIATGSRWASIGVGGILAFKGGGPLGLAIYGAGLAGGWAGAQTAEFLHTADYFASGLEYLGMHRVGQGGEHPATVDHQVAHSNALAGFFAAVAIGIAAAVATAVVIGAVIATGGAALVVIGAAAAGGFAGGFLATTVGGGIAQTGTRTGPIITGSPHLLINGKRAARMTDTANCNRESTPSPIVQGSETIYVDGLPMARIGHKLLCDAVIDEGVASVKIDKTVVQCATPVPDVPVSIRVAADWIGFLPWGRVSAYLANKVAPRKVNTGVPQETATNTTTSSVKKNVKIDDILSSQKSASNKMRDGRTISEVAEDMRNNGWDHTKDPPDVVDRGNGKYQTLDHRRVIAAKEAGLKEIPANVHAADEPLPPEFGERFKFEKTFTDPKTGKVYYEGDLPTTWGEAAMGRAAKQGENFPLYGSENLPKVTGKK